MQQEVQPVVGQHRPEHLGRAQDMGQTQHRQGRKPHQHDRTEEAPDPLGPPTLDHEQGHQDPRGDRDHERLQGGGGDPQALHGAQDRDRGGQHPVPEEQGRPEEPHEHQQGKILAMLGHHLVDQGGQGQDSTLAVVIRAQDEDDVLDGDDHHQGPEDQGQDPQDLIRPGVIPIGVQRLAHRVDGACADVAIDHAQGPQREGCQIPGVVEILPRGGTVDCALHVKRPRMDGEL